MTSCQGQDKTKNSIIKNTSSSIGTTVSELDDKIWAIYQDNNNNYWFGSNGKGVYRYDGTVLNQFTTQDGLIDNQIRGIQEDQQGNIFIETPKGVSKFDGESITLQPIISESNEWKLVPDDLWFNCNGNPYDVYRYDGKDLYELKLPRQELQSALDLDVQALTYNPYSVFGIDKDKEGNIWFGTAIAGAFRFNGNSFLWIGEKELSILDDGRVPGVRSILEDEEGHIWLSNFLSRYFLVHDQPLGYEKLNGIDLSNELLKDRLPYFNSGLVDENGNLWMTTYSGGVWKYDGAKLSNFPVKEQDTEVLLISIYQDNQGIIWLGSDNAGVYNYDEKEFIRFTP